VTEERNQAIEDLLAASGWGGSALVPFAQGGASQLYLLELRDGRRAVVKAPRYEARPAEEHRQIERGLAFEAAILRAASSPFLPSLIGCHPTGLFLLRDFVPGVPLITCNPRDPGLPARLTRLLELARDLFPLFHGHQPEAYVIRDLKPTNLIWDHEQEKLMLVDVGSARPVSRARARTTRRVTRLGSGKWLFWAPEQLLERDRLPNQSADYFALGATAFFLITGKPPYSNLDPDPQTALQSYLKAYPRVVSELQQQACQLGISSAASQFFSNSLHPLAEARPVSIPALESPHPKARSAPIHRRDGAA
jgi:serine/threonine protein kinase